MFDFQAGEGADGRDGFEIQRIRHGERERGIPDGEWHETALAQEARREAFDFGDGGRRRIDRDERQAELIGEGGEHVAHAR